MNHTRAWKEQEMQYLKKLINDYNYIGVASLERMPSSILANIRKKLKGKAVIRVTKKRVVLKALKEANVPEDFLEDFKGPILVIFSNEEPFDLYRELKKSKGKAPAKVGMVSPTDIEIPEGDTGIPPGPALSDFKAVGLNPRVQGGSIYIPKAKVVVKKGEVVSDKVASVLQKLGIKPIEIVLNVYSIYSKVDGIVYKKDVLDISPEEYKKDVLLCSSHAFNLAMKIGWITRLTAKPLVVKGVRISLKVGEVSGIPSKEVLPQSIKRAVLIANKLNTYIGGDK